MFSQLRWFSVVIFLLVAVAAIGAGIGFKSIASKDLEDLVKNNNVALAQGYVNTTWKKHRENLEKLTRLGIPTAEWTDYKEFLDFQGETLSYFEEMPVTGVNIYTPEGVLIFSGDSHNTRSSLDTADTESFKKALATQTNSRIIKDKIYRRADGKLATGTLVQTFMPIFSDYYVPVITDNAGEKAVGVMEIFYNVTPQWDKLWTFQWWTTGGIIVLFLVIITILVVSSRKAESIIERQHEVNLELTAAAAAAEAENRAKSQFLANISHELRTPLNAIIGFSEILRNEAIPSLNTTHQEYVRDIHGSGVHLLSLINDILDFSKAEAGKLEVHISEIDCVKLIKNSMRLVIPRAEQAQVMLVEELPEKHFTLQTDAKKVKQVLLNLLSNAVKFTPAGGQVKVGARHNIANDTIVITVQDTGIGISPKDISKVMQPFGQVDSTLARKYEGTGLGLPLSKKFVEVLGGTFTIESEVNAGTTVTVALPRVFKRDAAQTSQVSDVEAATPL